jgi:hypothetical protein
MDMRFDDRAAAASKEQRRSIKNPICYETNLAAYAFYMLERERGLRGGARQRKTHA